MGPASGKDKKLGKFQQVSSLNMQDGESKKVWLKGVSFQVMLIKKVFTNCSKLIVSLDIPKMDIRYVCDCFYHNISLFIL